MLFTHGGLFRWHSSEPTKGDGGTWYACAHKKTKGCNARAKTVKKTVVEEDGSTREEDVLVAVARPEVINIFSTNSSYSFSSFQIHSQYHVPDSAQQYASKILVLMQEAVRKNPLQSVGM